MKKRRESFLIIMIAILVMIFITGLYWLNLRVFDSVPVADSFHVYWESIRNLLLYKYSPYSAEVSTKIHSYYSNELLQNRPLDFNVTYPLYGGIVFIPFALISDYTVARGLWIILLEIALTICAWMSIRITGWRPGIGLGLFVVLFTLGWYFSVVPLITGHVIILVTLFTLLALAAIKSNIDELAGLSLAFTTIIPQVVCLLWLLIWIWAISHKRWRLIIWMIGGVVVLSCASSLIIPDWILQYIRLYRTILPLQFISTPGDIFKATWPGLGSVLGILLSILSLLILIIEWWLVRKKDFRWLAWTVSVTLVISQWSGIPTNPVYFVVLLLPLFLVLSTLEEHWGSKVRWFLLLLLILLFCGFWIPFIDRFREAVAIEQYPILFFPLPMVLLLGLYWIRWWTIRPRRSSLTKLYTLEE